MEAIGTRELKTARLTLRKMKKTDAEELFSAGVFGVSPEQARSYADNILACADEPMTFHWVLEYHGRAVGRIKACEISQRDNYAQLGYDIGAEYRCLGLMTEAVRAAVRFLLTDAGFHRVYCRVRESNLPSIRVCEKAGMSQEGTLRQHFSEPDGTYVDVRVYGLLAGEI